VAFFRDIGATWRGRTLTTKLRQVVIEHVQVGRAGSLDGMSRESRATRPSALAVVKQGQIVRLHSIYDSPHAADDVMGIMLGYIHPAPEITDQQGTRGERTSPV
jgi:hypothetical protein